MAELDVRSATVPSEDRRPYVRPTRAASFLPVACSSPVLKPTNFEGALTPEVEETHDPLELHFRKMIEYPLLTRDDELLLAKQRSMWPVCTST